MRSAQAQLSTAIVCSVLLCTTGAARALGFGADITASYLGQPLDFAATVRLQPDESLPRECASAEVIAGESRLPPEAVRVTVEPGRRPEEPLVRVTTQVPIGEPIVTVNVTAGCQPRLTRSFVTLMDPPGLNLAQSGEPPPSLPPQRLDSQVSAVVAAAQATAAGATPTPPAPRAERRAPARPRVAPPVRRPSAERSAARERRVAAARPARPRSGGARLQLEPATVLAAAPAASAAPADTTAAAAAPAADAATSAAAAAASAAPGVIAVGAAASAASAAEAAAQRVTQLEASLAQLREESLATQKALMALQASLKEAQEARYANPVVYALAWLSGLLALAVAALWWRQSQARSGTQWWLAPANAGAAPAVRPVVPRGPLPDAGAARVETAPAVMDERPVMRTLDDLPMPLQASRPPLVPAAAPVMLADPPVLRRELSVEELIDLEQQADFFVVLGQDEAAIDLLMGHVRSSGGVSPLPYLKLLEIYRRRGDREAYERIRERFNRRFSAYAPEWDADLAQGRSIDDYAKMLIQLQRLWDEPTRVTQMLDAALMRQDGSGETYDLPAYRELLFLYSIARDLAEHPVAPGDVDLLLPLEGEVAERPIEKLTASRLMGFASTEQHEPTVDLDITTPLRGATPAPPSDFLGLLDPGRKDSGSGWR